MYHHLYHALTHQRASSLRGAADATRPDRRHPAIEAQPPRVAALNRLHRLITATP